MAEPLTIVSVGAGALALLGVAWHLRRPRGAAAAENEQLAVDAGQDGPRADGASAIEGPDSGVPGCAPSSASTDDAAEPAADTWVMTREELDVIARVATRADGGRAFKSTARELAQSLARGAPRARDRSQGA